MKPIQKIEKLIMECNDENKEQIVKEVKEIIYDIIKRVGDSGFDAGKEFAKKYYCNKKEKNFIRKLLSF